MSCITPETIANPAFKVDKSAQSQINVPCGKCPQCLILRTNSWQFRLLQHEKISTSAHFVTLTYGTNDQPGFNLTPNGLNTLVKRDLQLYFKRLRGSYVTKFVNEKTNRINKDYSTVPAIKYFACGEYGSRRQRPHYHAIIFNADESQIREAWPHGFVHIGTVTLASISYTLKYMHKGRIIPEHATDDRLPEFQCTSKGLGENYVNSQTIRYHHQNIERNFVTFPGGVKAPMPRYYKQKIYSKSQLKVIANLNKIKNDEKMTKEKTDFEHTYPTDNYYRSKVESVKSTLETHDIRQKERNSAF